MLVVPLAALLALAAADAARAQDPLSTAFTYQGELRVSGQPAGGAFDFEVALYNVATGGSSLAVDTADDVVVAQGLFALDLDYTDVPFRTASHYWLELRVRDGASSGAYTPLLPRQPLHATPYALHALSVAPTALSATAPARPVQLSQLITLPGPVPTTAGDSCVTVGTDGLPIVGVHDSGNGNLVAIHCDEPGCTRRTMTVLDSAGTVGSGCAIGIMPWGTPAISYYDETNRALKLARCGDRACTTATIATVDAVGNAGQRSAIVQGAGGIEILYHDETGGDVELATCGASSCTLTTIDATNVVGRTLDAVRYGSRLVIAYSDDTASSAKLKTCLGFATTCATATPITITTDATGNVADLAIAVPPDRRPVVFYAKNLQLRGARCDSPDCATTSPTQNPIPRSSSRVAAVLGGDGLPLVVSLLLASPLSTFQLVQCTDAACSGDINGYFAAGTSTALSAHPAITLGSHGFPVITRRASANLELTVCDNPECGSGARRR
jgi:Fe-S cluster biogenesis protein NfuA